VSLASPSGGERKPSHCRPEPSARVLTRSSHSDKASVDALTEPQAAAPHCAGICASGLLQAWLPIEQFGRPNPRRRPRRPGQGHVHKRIAFGVIGAWSPNTQTARLRRRLPPSPMAARPASHRRAASLADWALGTAR